jgi:hypothetical protein
MIVNLGRTIAAFPVRGKRNAATPAAMDLTSILLDMFGAPARAIFNNSIWLKTFSCYTVRKVENTRCAK